MWVEKLANGKYKFCERYEDPLTGKLKKVSLTNTKNTKAIREDMLIKLNEKIQESLNSINKNDLTFKQASESFISLAKQNVKASTISRSETNLRVINPVIGETLLTKLKSSHINNLFLTNMENGRLSYNTVKQMRSLIIRIIKHAARYHGINRLDMINEIEVPNLNRNTVNDLKYLERDEIEILLNYLDNNKFRVYKRMAQIQISTGMRYGEMVSLDYEKHINFEENTIQVARNYDFDNRVFTSPKTGDERTIYFNDEVKKIIKEQIIYDKLKMIKYGIDKENTLLFKTSYGHPKRTSDFNRILKKVPLEKNVTTHYFRHTFITLAVENVISKELIAKQVGHADTTMIDRVYAHFTNKIAEQKKKAMLDFKVI